MLKPVSSSEENLVRATWNRRFWGFQILAFGDHSFLIDFGSNKEAAFGDARLVPSVSVLDRVPALPEARRVGRSSADATAL